MKNRKILITGATDGIGKTTAVKLAEMGHSIIVHGRSEEKCKSVLHEIKSKNSSYVVGDLSSFEEIYKISEQLHSSHEKIDTLLNNAGVYMNSRKPTKEGYEMTFAVNHLSVFLLTHLLFDLIKKSSSGRIVTVSSLANVRGRIDFKDLNGKNYESYKAYSQSKLANILFAFELSERIKNNNITSNALHPGVITTKLLETGFNIKGKSTDEGAKTSIYLSVSDEVKNVSGKYFDNLKEAPYNPAADDINLRKELWRVSEELTNIDSAKFLN
ncbi:MAG: hypothetical protein CMF23_14955 [Ignavibacteriae bacterium]|nr:hypothetical protein [Ignavibacteriota bacterium]